MAYIEVDIDLDDLDLEDILDYIDSEIGYSNTKNSKKNKRLAKGKENRKSNSK